MSDTAVGATERLRLREHQLFLALSIVIGILAGLAAVLFSLAIDRVDALLFTLDTSPTRVLLTPVIGSLIAGVLLATIFRGVRGSGVPQTKAAFHLDGGIIPARVPFGKFLTGVLCIGTGHSLGREGPSVQIGAGLASVIGQWLRLSPARIKELVPIGTAGALAAAFNTPIAAVLFALEEIIGDLNATLLGATVIASAASVVVERSILGNEPLFQVPAYHLVHPAELIGYGVLGVLGGIVSLVFCSCLLRVRGWFQRMPRWSVMLQPALGGLAIGGTLIVFPEVKGVGYDYVNQALNGDLLLGAMMTLGVVKLAATVVSYSSGNAGGIFAPSLFVGAMTGGVVGLVVKGLAPFPTGDPGAYALVGMGTLFAGIIRAPMTSVFMIFEITQDYQILVPLMVANLLSFAISRRFQPVAVYDALLRQDHVHLPSTLRAGRGWTAREVMISEVPMVGAGLSIDAALAIVQGDGGRARLVGAPDHVIGIVTAERLVQLRDEGRGADPIDAAVDPLVAHVHPDHPLEIVLERLAEHPILPVVSRADVHRVEGIVTAEGLAARWGHASHKARRSAAGASGTPDTL